MNISSQGTLEQETDSKNRETEQQFIDHAVLFHAACGFEPTMLKIRIESGEALKPLHF